MTKNKVLEKIYMSKTEPRLIYKSCKNLRQDIEYIRKDVVDKMIEDAKYRLLMRQDLGRDE